MTNLDLGRQNSDSPQHRLLRSVHEVFARELSIALSAFLESEIGVRLESVKLASSSDFRQTLKAPSCLINLQLDPRPESAVLSLDCATVFSLLELLLGGKTGSGLAETRGLTEIEWSLLEEVVRVVVASLGESWKTFHAVEFRVQSLESDPEFLPASDPGLRLVQLGFALQLGEQAGSFQIGVPQAFFEPAAGPIENTSIEPAAEDVQRNFALLADAKVELEVMLNGTTIKFQELADLSAGQVVRFDYPLQKPLRALVNGEISIACQIVSAGSKRAFQVEELP
jgi:flagellar motor switch protein FliM